MPIANFVLEEPMGLRLILFLGAMSVACAEVGHGQTISNRVAEIRDGAVAFHFTSRPGICGDGERYIRTGKNTHHGSWSTGRELGACVPGPVQVRLTLANGSVSTVQYWVGALRDRAERDLGRVPAPEAARYLLSVASAGTLRASAGAMMPAVLADSALVWPALLAIARDRDRPRPTRSEARIWLARFAGAAVAGRPNEPFLEDEDEAVSADDDLKRHAVFVLSQLRRGEGVPALLDVARSPYSWRVRSHALFWLAQTDDPRAIDLFESLLCQTYDCRSIRGAGTGRGGS